MKARDAMALLLLASAVTIIGVAQAAPPSINPSTPKAPTQGGGPSAPKPSAAPAPSVSMAPSGSQIWYYKPSATGEAGAVEKVSEKVTLRCGEGYTLHVFTQNGPTKAYCHKIASAVDGRKPSCGSAKYLLTDDKYLPIIKSKFGKTDQCFKNDINGRPRDDFSNYSPPYCGMSPESGDLGYKLVVKDGQDSCDKPIEIPWTHTPGNVGDALMHARDAAFRERLVQCPTGSTMMVDKDGTVSPASTAAAVTPVPGNLNGVVCKRN